MAEWWYPELLNALLGPHCPYGCGQRIYPNDMESHTTLEHAGDQP